MNIYIVSFRLHHDYGLYEMIVVAHDYDEAENLAKLSEPYCEIGSVELIKPDVYQFATITHVARYIE